ncbi:unnamed protein product [Citrullus colocynthis]|uniref:Uncharacterized protein n=1 Tax=Citrullus colocynthis TaxID=252529 RepID=A0ABP0Y1F3_9ROSI
MMQSQVSREEAIHLVVVGLVLGEEEIDPWGKMNASSVDAQGIRHETVLHSVVDVVGAEVHFHHVLNLIVMVVGTVLEETVTDILMTVIMEGDMVIEIVLIVKMTSMEVKTAILTTGTHLLEIALPVVIGVAVIGMVAEVLAIMREEVIGAEQALMTIQAGEGDCLPTTVTSI